MFGGFGRYFSFGTGACEGVQSAGDQGSSASGSSWSYLHYILPLLVMMIISGVALLFAKEPDFQHGFWFAFGSAAFLALVVTFAKLLRDHRL
jgi:hypothetical protein